MSNMFKNLSKKAKQAGYKSGLEDTLGRQISSKGIEVLYEDKQSKIPYVKPETKHKYTPDFVLPNAIIIESKGLFTAVDRAKHILIKQQHPSLDIRFVFNRSASKLSKSSKTTYAQWCIKNGFKYADGKIPDSWFLEPVNPYEPN